MSVNRYKIRAGFEKYMADVEAELKKPKQDKLLNAMLIAMGVPAAVYQMEEMEKYNGHTRENRKDVEKSRGYYGSRR